MKTTIQEKESKTIPQLEKEFMVKLKDFGALYYTPVGKCTTGNRVLWKSALKVCFPKSITFSVSDVKAVVEQYYGKVLYSTKPQVFQDGSIFDPESAYRFQKEVNYVLEK